MIKQFSLFLCLLFLAACTSFPVIDPRVAPKEFSNTQVSQLATSSSTSAIAASNTTTSGNPKARTSTPVPTVFMPTPLPETEIPPTPTTSPVPPDEACISPIFGEQQSLPLSCEARAAADWANFFSVPIQEIEFQNRLPLSDDPDLGFVGDPNGVWGNIPPRAYGVHAGPVAALLRQYGLPAEARRFMTLDELKNEIAHGRPVIVWVVGHIVAGTPQVYTSHAGR